MTPRQTLSLLLTILSVPSMTRAAVKPAAIFSDHMVLQQGAPIPIWGTADAGEVITVTLGDQKITGVTGKDLKWMLRLPGQKAGGPVEMTIAGTNSITIKDILIGEVWVGSGQSNMEFTVSKARASFAGLVNEAQEIAAADYPKIRMFTVGKAKTYDPQSNFTGKWEVCTPATVPGFSAVGYLFARDLHKRLDQPVGIITSAYGASTAEAWISRDMLAGDPLLKPMLDHFDAGVKFFRENPDRDTPTSLRGLRTRSTRKPPPPVAASAIRCRTSINPPSFSMA